MFYTVGPYMAFNCMRAFNCGVFFWLRLYNNNKQEKLHDN